MKQNMSLIDRYVRWTLAVVLIALAGAGVITGVWMWVAGILALIFLVTGWVQFCPLYYPFGITTLKKTGK
ncbi:MAG TPA: DUF2892 domain-containing protein [Bacteroidetes bacterium]|nr:DUF2892 domain-containing protein [Bacteroidota bacterium]